MLNIRVHIVLRVQNVKVCIDSAYACSCECVCLFVLSVVLFIIFVLLLVIFSLSSPASAHAPFMCFTPFLSCSEANWLTRIPYVHYLLYLLSWSRRFVCWIVALCLKHRSFNNFKKEQNRMLYRALDLFENITREFSSPAGHPSWRFVFCFSTVNCTCRSTAFSSTSFFASRCRNALFSEKLPPKRSVRACGRFSILSAAQAQCRLAWTY